MKRTPLVVVGGESAQLPAGDVLADQDGNLLNLGVSSYRLSIVGSSPGPGIECALITDDGLGLANAGSITVPSTVMVPDTTLTIGSGPGAVTFTTNAAGTSLAVSIDGQTPTNVLSTSIVANTTGDSALYVLPQVAGSIEISLTNETGASTILTNIAAGKRIDILVTYITS